MPGQGRLGDKAFAAVDQHGCPACPHPAVGPAIVGSPDIMVNKKPALRVDDKGIHTACCGSNTWTAVTGSSTVFINGKAAHRMGDLSSHCGGMGLLIEGSPNVIVGGAVGVEGVLSAIASSAGSAAMSALQRRVGTAVSGAGSGSSRPASMGVTSSSRPTAPKKPGSKAIPAPKTGAQLSSTPKLRKRTREELEAKQPKNSARKNAAQLAPKNKGSNNVGKANAASKIKKRVDVAAGPVKPGDRGDYGDLKAQKRALGETEPLDIDHQPSFAAQKAAAERELKRPLTPREARALKKSTPAAASPRAIHQQTSPTYGGRNNPKRIAEDADDLEASAARDKAAFDEAMKKR